MQDTAFIAIGGRGEDEDEDEESHWMNCEDTLRLTADLGLLCLEGSLGEEVEVAEEDIFLP